MENKSTILVELTMDELDVLKRAILAIPVMRAEHIALWEKLSGIMEGESTGKENE